MVGLVEEGMCADAAAGLGVGCGGCGGWLSWWWKRWIGDGKGCWGGWIEMRRERGDHKVGVGMLERPGRKAQVQALGKIED